MSHHVDVLNAELDRLRLEVHTLKAESGAQMISIGNYLLTRLEQLDVTVSEVTFPVERMTTDV